MNNIPRSKELLNDSEELINIFSSLIGTEFILTGKTRTDGANLRMLIFKTLINNKEYDLLSENEYEILTDKAKGLPRIMPEFLDTYLTEFLFIQSGKFIAYITVRSEHIYSLDTLTFLININSKV